ncbi:MAG: aryl-sulfate sulfotransferase [Ignavibacteriales bacterium]|nr:aryl-sulfate sulfotransferase [Ignavibacteriales bacterium]
MNTLMLRFCPRRIALNGKSSPYFDFTDATASPVTMTCLAIFFLLHSSCDTTTIEPSNEFRLPEIREFFILENEYNVLSVVGKVETKFVTYVKVEYGTDNGQAFSTPWMPATDTTTRIAVLGLEPDKSYWAKAIAVSRDGDEIRSDSMFFATKSLPDDIPHLVIQHMDYPTPGYVTIGFTGVFNHAYTVIFNNEGRILWYRKFEGSVFDFQKQPNNKYTVCVSVSSSSSLFYEMDNLGSIIRSYKADADKDTDIHELRIADSSHALFGIEYRFMDLTELGGVESARVKGIVVEYHRPGASPFLWNTFDHLKITDASPNISLTGQTVNPWHANALELDTDDNLLVSFRHCNEITKIDSRTGSIVWRLGGKNNQFTFMNDPFNGFSHQHGIRRLDNGNIILFDNGNTHEPQESRAVEYMLDENNKKATMVWQYRSSPALFSSALGFAQRLENGNTFITYGRIPRIIEVDMSGNKRWEASVDPPGQFVYRAFKINSLY